MIFLVKTLAFPYGNNTLLVVECSVDSVFNSSNGSLQGVREMCLEEAENASTAFN